MQAIPIFLHNAFAQSTAHSPFPPSDRTDVLCQRISTRPASDFDRDSPFHAGPGVSQTRHQNEWIAYWAISHLHAERPLFYWVIFQALLGSFRACADSGRLVSIRCTWQGLCVEGSDAFAPGVHFPFQSVFMSVRAVRKYGEQTPRTLALMLPTGCIPVLVSDAGFSAPMVQGCRGPGWYYVS